MDTSQFRAAGAGPPGPRTSSADGPARRCTARPASSHDVGNARVLDRGSAPGSASPVAAYRAAPVTRRAGGCPSARAGGCPSAGHNKVGHQHHSRHGAPDATQRWGSSQILSCFRTAGNYCETLPASGRAPRVVAAGSALSQKHYASRLWPSGLSRVAPRQSSTPAIELARWRAKSLGHF